MFRLDHKGGSVCMDEILRTPQKDSRLHGPRKDHAPADGWAKRIERLKDRWSERLEGAGALKGDLALQSARVYHRMHSAVAGKPKMAPLPFLALAAVIGVAGVVGTLYSPAYVLTVDGVDVGVVQSKSVYQEIEARVESRASQILGYDYTIDHEVTYELALTKREDLTPTADVENYLFDQIGAITKAYTLRVDGQLVGMAQDRAALDAMLDELAAPYVNENTIAVDYTKTVHITQEYVPSDSEQDTAAMMAALTANTNGQTTYEVQAGDTFMALAFDNDMTMAEMEALNPDIDINKLYIGQILNIKEEIPYLGVQTVDSLTYTEAIECPVQEVEDDSMYQGDSKVLDEGIPGEALVTADVTYLNGVEKDREVTSSTTVREATERVIAVGTKERPTWYPTGNYVWPVYGTITSRFGYRYIFGSTSYHSGLDIAVPYGTSIRASDGGTVSFAGYKGSYGYLVIIDHGNGEQTYYGHNSQLLVSAGDKVYQGQTIAKAGSTGRSTGSHCHFEIRINGTSVNPTAYLN